MLECEEPWEGYSWRMTQKKAHSMAAGQPSSMVHPADVDPALAMWVDFAAVQDPRVLVAFENGFGPKACPEEKMGYPRLVIVQRTRVLAFAVNYCRGLSESAVAGVEDRGQAENSHLEAHHSGHSGSCLRAVRECVDVLATALAARMGPSLSIGPGGSRCWWQRRFAFDKEVFQLEMAVYGQEGYLVFVGQTVAQSLVVMQPQALHL